MKNFRAVGQGSKAAERVEVVEEFKVEELPAFMPHPLLRTLPGRHKQVETEEVGRMSRFSLRPCSTRHTPTEDSDLVYGGLRPCTGGHTPMEEEKEEADLVYGGLLPRASRHILAKQDGEVKDSLTAAKRKADDSGGEKAVASGSGDVKAPEIKWVEMPLEHIAWLLAQKREEGLIPEIMATDEAGKEEFFAFQEWVRETFDKNGCVMVPEGFNGPNPGGLQDLIDEEWEKGMHELEMIDGCPPFHREEDTAVALPSN